MRIVAIDPGNMQSAYVVLDGLAVVAHGILPNERMLDWLRTPVFCEGAEASGLSALVVEMVQSFGMAVGKEVFETVFWIGRFCQASQFPFHRVYRSQVKMHLCGNVRAKDANIRQALIDKLGPQGTKRSPGPTYGISKDVWSALAVGVTWQESVG
jgi:hypothetical protein